MTAPRYGAHDGAAVLMSLGHRVAVRKPHPAEPSATLRMTDGTMQRVTWLVDGQPVSWPQLEYAAARAASSARAASLLTSAKRR